MAEERPHRRGVILAAETSARVEELAAAQATDFGFAELPLGRGGVEVETFCRAPLVLAVPGGYLEALAHRDEQSGIGRARSSSVLIVSRACRGRA